MEGHERCEGWVVWLPSGASSAPILDCPVSLCGGLAGVAAWDFWKPLFSPPLGFSQFHISQDLDIMTGQLTAVPLWTCCGARHSHSLATHHHLT